MKLILIATIIILIIYFFWFKSKKKTQKAPNQFLNLISETESIEFLPTLKKGIFEDIELKYKNSDFSPYSNVYNDITDEICNKVYSKSKYWENNLNHLDFLNRLTQEQRIYFTLVNFEAQVNNGGVYQFLFNYPELSIIALEAMEILKMETLKKDYTDVLNEYFGKFDDIQKLKLRFNEQNSNWDKRWNAFAEGYNELKSAEVIEAYFYNNEFIKEFQNAMYDYAKNNNGKLYVTE